MIRTLVTLLAVGSTGGLARRLTPADGDAYVDALATTNRFCPVRCAEQIFQPESTEDLAQWMRSEGSKLKSFTVKGSGHSYGCQSVPDDGGVMVHTALLNKAEVVKRADGTAFARLGAGHNFQDIMPRLDKMGYSMPHGECITVGLAGWLLNLGGHPETGNYRRYYGDAGFLTKVTGVDYDGNVFVVDKDGIQYVDKEDNSFFAKTRLRLRERWTNNWANLLELGFKLKGFDEKYPTAGKMLRVLQVWGASLMVATEFEVELLQRKEPTYLLVTYDIDLFRDNNDKLEEIFALVEDESEDVTCGLAFASEATPGRDGISLKCVDWSSEEGDNVMAAAPSGYSTITRIPYSAFFVWNKDSYGMGWTPQWFGQKYGQFKNSNGLDKWRRAVLKLADPANPCNSCSSELLNTADLELFVVDILCGATVENQAACSAYSYATQDLIAGRGKKAYKQNLPSCKANKKWKSELIEYEDSYWIAEKIKSLWDPKQVVDFWLGIGHDNDEECEATVPKDIGATCKAAGITGQDLVESVKRDAVERCPQLFSYESFGEQNSKCGQYWGTIATPLPIVTE